MKETVQMKIYFKDLNEDAQTWLLSLFRTTPEEENWDTVPIAIIEREMEGE